MGMGGVRGEILSGAEGATLWSSGPEIAKSLQPFRADDKLESAGNGGNTQSGGPRRGGASGVLRIKILQSSKAKLLFLRWGVLGRGVGNQPLSVLPFWKILQLGDRPRAPEMAFDNAKADGKADEVELTPAGI